jgi:hypothetical protein
MINLFRNIRSSFLDRGAAAALMAMPTAAFELASRLHGLSFTRLQRRGAPETGFSACSRRRQPVRGDMPFPARCGAIYTSGRPNTNPPCAIAFASAAVTALLVDTLADEAGGAGANERPLSPTSLNTIPKVALMNRIVTLLHVPSSLEVAPQPGHDISWRDA